LLVRVLAVGDAEIVGGRSDYKIDRSVAHLRHAFEAIAVAQIERGHNPVWPLRLFVQAKSSNIQAPEKLQTTKLQRKARGF
jgi:hypothetical protein